MASNNHDVEYIPALGRSLSGRMLDIWHGRNIDPKTAERYRLKWLGVKRPINGCVHRGEVIEKKDAAGITCSCPGKWLTECKKHEECTIDQERHGVECCRTCSDHEVSQTRHLLYHLWPNGEWKWHLKELDRRLHLFNGKRVVGIARDAHHNDEAEHEFKQRGFEIIHATNKHKLREVVTWVPLWSSLQGYHDVAFYAHGKGVRHKTPVTQEWTKVMYSACLDYWPHVSRLLAHHPIAGCFKKLGRAFGASPSRWHYSGTFFWVRLHDFWQRPWRDVERVWYGTEAYPGVAYGVNEAATIFYSAEMHKMDLYKPEQMTQVLREFETWKHQNRKSFKVILA